MAERRAITKQLQARYRRARKVQKSQMLDELCALTGWSRGHARQALAGSRKPKPGHRRPRPVIYDGQVLEALRKVWATLGGICGKRLAPFLPEAVPILERCGELDLSPQVRAKLTAISAASIDRLLAPERARLQVKGRSGTKPGTLLKRHIPIRTFADWDERSPGFCEVDLVAHDGGNPAGEFCQTLDLTCVFSGWTQARAVPTKAQRHVFDALRHIEATLPFALSGLDSDNGSEFINAHLLEYCAANRITFTRSRVERKNDNGFVEQKNWSVVRQAVGYLRYDTPEELEVLNELYGHLRLWVNFFQPQMRLVEKVRDGAKVTRRYDTARTPFHRLMEHPAMSPSTKRALTRQYRELNPAQLKRDIAACQDRLVVIGQTKPTIRRREVKPPPDHPWNRTFSVRQRKARSRTT